MELNIANTVFMILSTSLVMLMTPGLAFFYGGLVGKKNVLTIMMQNFISLGITTILWYAIGYSLCFSGDIAGVIGNLDMMFMNGIGINDLHDNGFPMYIFFGYQMMFAIITPSLITGAFTNRVRLEAYIPFLIFWQIFVYYPFVHMIWGGGILAQWGVLDFAGGVVVHATAGMAALAAVFYVGKRKVVESGPHSIPLVAIGTGLLWFGWYGFNAGSELAADNIAGLAFINTDIAASFAAITWLFIEWKVEGQPKFIGLLTGAIGGLATITPAAGFVPTWAAAIIGIVAGAVCFMAVSYKNKMQWDDALDVWGVHGVGGIIGTIMLGIFATTSVNAAGANGLLFGDISFFFKQIVAVLLGGGWGFFFTLIMLRITDIFISVRIPLEQEEKGVDTAFGEDAYI